MEAELPGSRLRMMQSSGGLTEAARFRGRDAVLSGPAGGAVALKEIARLSGESQVIGFDMGGTSTDVSRCAGRLEHVYETQISGVRIRTPIIDIHTIAAGGGSLCRFDGHKLSVGPESAGARPGPLCYGDAQARELALTDVHLALGRLAADRFPFSLDSARGEQALEDLATEVEPTGDALQSLRVAEGFFEIAVESMAEAIRRVTIARGHDVREHALVVFGGAGGQAACSVARRLGVRKLLFHPLAGVLSAYGMGVADDTWHGERGLTPGPTSEAGLRHATSALDTLCNEGVSTLTAIGHQESEVRCERLLELRYEGTETSITLPELPCAELQAAFHHSHSRTFGYERTQHPIELIAARVAANASPVPSLQKESEAVAPAALVPSRQGRLFLQGRWLEGVPVYQREALPVAVQVMGPALILDATGSIALEPGFVAERRPDELLVVTDCAGAPIFARAPEGALRRWPPMSNVTPCCSKCSITSSCRWPNRWAPSSNAPRSPPTFASAWISPAPSSIQRRARGERSAHPGASGRHG